MSNGDIIVGAVVAFLLYQWWTGQQNFNGTGVGAGASLVSISPPNPTPSVIPGTKSGCGCGDGSGSAPAQAPYTASVQLTPSGMVGTTTTGATSITWEPVA